jgi:hypothetical protein
MRKLLLGTLLGAAVLSNAGCVVPIYSPEPTRRTLELLNTSENLRMVTDEWERLWLLDMPSHLTPYRVHGGM